MAASPSVHKTSDNPLLFAQDKHAGLASKADFLHLTILADEQGVIGGFDATVFPAALGLGNNLPAFLYGRFVAVDLQKVFTSLQLGFAELGALGDVNGLRKGFRKGRHGKCDGGQ